jgi:hypothetical protein
VGDTSKCRYSASVEGYNKVYYGSSPLDIEEKILKEFNSILFKIKGLFSKIKMKN